MKAGSTLQIVLELGSGTENESFNVRHVSLAFTSFLSLKQRSQLLGFEVGESVRIINSCQFAVRFPSPTPGITPKSTGSALDLDQEEPLWRKDEQIDFVNTSVVRDEFKIGPHPIRLMRRELGAHEFESFSFPREARLGDRRPIFACCHLGSHSR